MGLSYIISKTVLLFNILKWIGALYLIYIGICALRSSKKTGVQANDDCSTKVGRQITTAQAFRIGLLTNVLNPKCALFFVSLFSVFITPSTPAFYRFGYGSEIVAIAVTWFCLLATILSTDKVKKIFERISVWLDRITGAILIALGLKIALSRN
jgi:threonine/homoserine/homoserine lactone efflux protein